MPISRDAVRLGFRMLLGRDVDDDAAIRAHMELPDESALAEVLFASKEFAMFNRFKRQIEVLAPAPPVYQGPRASTTSLPMMLLGNCQSRGLARLFRALTGNPNVEAHELLPEVRKKLDDGEFDARLRASSVVFLHDDDVRSQLTARLPEVADRLRLVPAVGYSAFHPDADYVFDGQGVPVAGLMGQYQSSIAFFAWSRGMDLEAAKALYCDEVYERLGFHAHPVAARSFLCQVGTICGLRLDDLIDAWSARGGPWMYSMNHPRLFVLADIARALLAREGIATIPGAEAFVEDDLAEGPVWPVYPEIAARLGFEGSLAFKLPRGLASAEQPVLMIGLDEFVSASFEVFSRHPRGSLRSPRVESARYQALAASLATSPVAGLRSVQRLADSGPSDPAARTNPYQGLADHQFWRRGVERVDWQAVDPVVHSTIRIAASDKVATAGSCFAQHISNTLERSGFRYFVTEEAPPGMSPAEASERNYRVFSARYGNLYTARQLLQLFERAHGRFTPVDDHWQRADGRWVDPFRPQVEPAGFADLDQLRASRQEHFDCVRRMFAELDVFIFTLGLTETWQHRADGAVYPLAPGVAGGGFDPRQHEFVNVGVADVVSDMRAFLHRLRGVNPRCRVLLTVSPVPLIATYEPRHVLVSSTLSKSVLRVAAQEIVDSEPACAYFPSYEIITGHYNRGAYFDTDLRSVRPDGVAHVMRLFMQHCSHSEHDDADAALIREMAEVSRVVCDEEAIDASTRR